MSVLFVPTALSLLSAKQAQHRTRVSARKRKAETPRRTQLPETTSTPRELPRVGVEEIGGFPEQLHSLSAEMGGNVFVAMPGKGTGGDNRATLHPENAETKNVSLDKQDISR